MDHNAMRCRMPLIDCKLCQITATGMTHTLREEGEFFSRLAEHFAGGK